MAKSEGRLVGDAIVVARSLGLVLDTAVVEQAFFERMARNENLAVGIAARAFLESAMTALQPTMT